MQKQEKGKLDKVNSKQRIVTGVSFLMSQKLSGVGTTRALDFGIRSIIRANSNGVHPRQ